MWVCGPTYSYRLSLACRFSRALLFLGSVSFSSLWVLSRTFPASSLAPAFSVLFQSLLAAAIAEQ